ncbi:MAG: carbon storage regulator [Planctomycetales bacterium]|nr:carbon storage regulator [Planctomycetales bacterium]
MLVLTRKLQEKITIAGNITVTVLRVKGQTVRIGIEAPREIRVVRGELPMEVAAEEASGDASGDASEESLTVPAAKSPLREISAESAATTASQPRATNRNNSRLPQRRKFDRYSQPPLKGASTHPQPPLPSPAPWVRPQTPGLLERQSAECRA